jgi:hypothetical protein
MPKLASYGTWLVAMLVVLLIPFSGVFGRIATAAPFVAVSILITAGLILTELVWRVSFRPHLSWNDAGVSIITPLSFIKLPWQEVSSVELRHGFVVFGTAFGQITFDLEGRWGKWWIRLISHAYRNAPRVMIERIQEARRRSLDGPSVGEPPSLSFAGRPYLLYGMAVMVSITTSVMGGLL